MGKGGEGVSGCVRIEEESGEGACVEVWKGAIVEFEVGLVVHGVLISSLKVWGGHLHK